MYEHFYGLRERPFSVTPDPRYLLLTPGHEEALSTLRYGLSVRAGVILIVGEAGTGKTTVLRAALSSPAEARDIVVLNNPTLTRAEFVEFIARELSLSNGAARSKARLMRELREVLENRAQEGRYATLVIDEAHTLSDMLLEEIRLLTNTERDTEKLLPVVLIGQPELADRLNTVSLRQLKQRVVFRCALKPLDLHQTAAYVAGRIRVAGGSPERLFTVPAVRTIYEQSRGIPRIINVICENALIAGFAAGERPVLRPLVSSVCEDLDLAWTPAVEGRPADEPLKAPAVAEISEQDRPSAPRSSPAPQSGQGLFASLSPRRRLFSFR